MNPTAASAANAFVPKTGARWAVLSTISHSTRPPDPFVFLRPRLNPVQVTRGNSVSRFPVVGRFLSSLVPHIHHEINHDLRKRRKKP